MRAVDTNVLVRLVMRDDAQQVVAAEQFVEKGAWASVLCIAEAAWVLGSIYGLNPRELAGALEMLLNQPYVVIQDSEAVSEAVTLFRAHPSLGFADCLMLQLARKAGHLPFGTFDRALGKLPGAQKL
jgi:predicted nucleic-acid-binding protein